MMERYKYYCCSLLFIIALTCVHSLDHLSDSKYLEMTICYGQDYIDQGCFKEEPMSRSRLACFVQCSLDPTCLSVLIYSPNASCYHGGFCSLSPFCTPKDADFRYYEKGLVETTSEVPATTQIYEQTTAPQMVQTTQTSPIVQTTEAPPVAQTTETILVTPECQNNGVPDNVSGTCDCTMTGGYIGDRCERAAKSCVGLYNYNYASGTHPLNVDLFGDGSVFFRTTCHLRNWFSTQISFDIMRSSGSFDASLSYQEYVSGFRFGPDDYWIGLENLHKYTSRGKSYKVRLTVNFNSSNAVGELAIGHNNFIVASSSEGYSYTLDSGLYRGSTLSVKGSPQGYGLDDVLLSQANVPFSAPDEDHDQSDSRHCAQEAQAGWWLGNCSPFVANPFGLSYRTMPGSATDQHFHVSGLDMSQPNVQEAVQFVYVSLDVPKDH